MTLSFHAPFLKGSNVSISEQVLHQFLLNVGLLFLLVNTGRLMGEGGIPPYKTRRKLHFYPKIEVWERKKTSTRENFGFSYSPKWCSVTPLLIELQLPSIDQHYHIDRRRQNDIDAISHSSQEIAIWRNKVKFHFYMELQGHDIYNFVSEKNIQVKIK